MPTTSLRSEAWSEPAKVHSSPRKGSARYANCRPREDSVLMSIPLPRDKILSHNEQYGCHGGNERDNNCFERQMSEKHKARKEKNTAENHSEERADTRSTKLPVSPLNTNRLQPTRHRTKKVILTILDNGEVCSEFTRRGNNIVRKKIEG